MTRKISRNSGKEIVQENSKYNRMTDAKDRTMKGLEKKKEGNKERK